MPDLVLSELNLVLPKIGLKSLRHQGTVQAPRGPAATGFAVCLDTEAQK